MHRLTSTPTLRLTPATVGVRNWSREHNVHRDLSVLIDKAFFVHKIISAHTEVLYMMRRIIEFYLDYALLCTVGVLFGALGAWVGWELSSAISPDLLRSSCFALGGFVLMNTLNFISWKVADLLVDSSA